MRDIGPKFRRRQFSQQRDSPCVGKRMHRYLRVGIAGVDLRSTHWQGGMIELKEITYVRLGTPDLEMAASFATRCLVLQLQSKSSSLQRCGNRRCAEFSDLLPIARATFPERSQNHEHLHRGSLVSDIAEPLLAEIRELAPTISARVAEDQSFASASKQLLDNSREYQARRDARQVVR
jgi:hypothetical protein